MEDTLKICSTFFSCVHEYQTLIAGLLAFIAALVGGAIVYFAATAPIKAEDKRHENATERRRRYTCGYLSVEFRRVSQLARQAEATIKVVIGANAEISDKTRSKVTIFEPSFLDDWEAMSLLTNETFEETMNVRVLLKRHNYDMARAGGAFGSDDFRQYILEQVKSLRQASFSLSHSLEREAKLKK